MAVGYTEVMLATFHPLILTLLMQTQPVEPSPPLLTVAEKSEYTATATSAEVVELIDRIKQRSSIMRTGEMGRTVEGKTIPLIFLANPPVDSIAAARAASKDRDVPICFIFANIHAGEVEGKEACLMLAREIALDSNHPFLNDLIVAIAPNYNADGNDKFDDVAKNRPGQDGPHQCGVRANSMGLDLNRDYVKLESPEARALVKLLNDLDPDVTVDCHTTNGSHHRYVLTYDTPLNPSGHPAPIEFLRNELLPEVTKRMKQNTGYDLWYYGNFNREHTTWEAYGSGARYGGPYQGLRSQMSILSEAYSYAPYKDRVVATREFLREILKFVAENKSKVIEINRRARDEVRSKGVNPQPSDVVSLRHRMAAYNEPVIVKGYERATGGEGGAVARQSVDLGSPKDYSIVHLGRFEPTLSVRRPYAYIIPPDSAVPGMNTILEKLNQHGIIVTPFQGDAMCEVYTITEAKKSERPFQGHHEMKVEVSAKLDRRAIAPGSHIVPIAQPLGTLAVYLLEPQSEDGLTTWNFLDDHIVVGSEYPILRVRTAADLTE